MTQDIQQESVPFQCAVCNVALSAKMKHGLCRLCYKKEHQIRYRQTKRNVTDLDEVLEDSTTIPPFKRPTFYLNAENQASSTSDDTLQSQRCLYDEGLIAACGLEHESKQHQDLLKAVLQASNMEPFGILHNGCEVNAMTTSKNVSILLSATPSHVSFAPCLPRVQTNIATRDLCNNFGDIGDKGIMQRALARSPLYKALQHTEFQPLSGDMITLLNGDWRFQPCLRFAASKLLAGCLLVDGSQLLYVNCVEPYHRLPTLDAHFERFSVSHLPASNVDLWVKKFANDNAQKVIICSQVADFLVVSSIRLDEDLGVDLGPTTNNFQPTSSTHIFVAKESIFFAQHIVEQNGQQSNERGDKLRQLRQIRSKFDAPSTYLLCRSSSILTDNVMATPYTIWTVADCDNSSARTNDVKLASQMLQLVAIAVTANDDHCLHLAELENLQQACRSKKAATATTIVIAEILDLFGEQETIKVLYNTELDRLLRDLANVATSALAKANQDVKTFVRAVFARQ